MPDCTTKEALTALSEPLPDCLLKFVVFLTFVIVVVIRTIACLILALVLLIVVLLILVVVLVVIVIIILGHSTVPPSVFDYTVIIFETWHNIQKQTGNFIEL